MKCLRPIYNGLYYIIWPLLYVVVRLVWPMRIIGKEHLKSSQSYVLAPNHVRAVDPVFVVVARGLKKKMLIMGKEELCHIHGFINWFWNVAGMFPIDRGTGDRQTVEQAVSEVKKGRALLIFPEGTRTKDGKLGRMKSGAFVVAQQAECSMVPCYIHYKTGKARPFSRVTVVFGAPLTLRQLGLEGPYSVKALRGAKELFKNKLECLREENEHCL